MISVQDTALKPVPTTRNGGIGSAESFPTFLPFGREKKKERGGKKRSNRKITDKEVRGLEYSQEQCCHMPQKWNG